MQTIELNGYKIEFYSEIEWSGKTFNEYHNTLPYVGLVAELVADIPNKLAEKIVDNNWTNKTDKYRNSDCPIVTKKYKNYNEMLFFGMKWLNYAKESFQTLSDLRRCYANTTSLFKL